MRRKLFTFLAAVSLLLCLTTAAMWVRSYHAADVVKWDRPVSHAMYHLRRLLSAGGVLTYTREDTGYPAGERIAPPWPPVHVYRLGGILIISVAYWLPFAATLLLPLLWALARLRPRRPPGVCQFCGYDLRATPGRCPECGLVPPH